MKNIKIIIYALGGLLAASILFFLFSFAYVSLESMSAQNVQERLQSEIKNEKDWKTIHTDWENIENSYKGFKKEYLMKTKDFNAFKMEIQSLAGQNGVSISKLNHQLKSMYKEVVKVSYNAEMTGSYDSVKRFIYEMENKKELVFFTKIQLTKNKTGHSRISGKFFMEAYFVR